jgi:hypothetical protein
LASFLARSVVSSATFVPMLTGDLHSNQIYATYTVV